MKHWWQHETASKMERHFRDHTIMPTLAENEKSLMRSQSGPFAGVALSVNFLTRIDPSLFRVLLLRRIRLPLPLSLRVCWPSTGSLWLLSCNMLESRVVGKAWICG